MRTVIRIPERLRLGRCLIAIVALMLLGGSSSWALLSTDYTFTTSTITYTPLTTATMVIAGTNGAAAGTGTFNDSASAGPFNIGFTFRFSCVAYTQFGVSTSGTVYLGGLKSNSFTNDLANAPFYPIIAPWWDHQHMYNNGGAANGCTFNPLVGVQYAVSGSAPNRILTIEFNTQVADNNGSLWWAGCGLSMNRYQVLLYETSNKIEFRYGSMWASSGQPTSGTIGIGASTTDYISVTPNGATATTSSAVSNNSIALHLTPINAGTSYTFTPCYFALAGTPPLATAGMASGDSMLTTSTVMVGNEGTYSPFTITMPAGGCPSHNYTMTISGTNATEYRFTATGNQTVSGSLAAGSSISYVMGFRPTAIGTRSAILTFTDNTVGCSSVYYIAAKGTPRITRTGNVAQGGTATMACGVDTLLVGKYAIRGTSSTFQPFSVTDNETGNYAGPANVTYSISGGAGQYTIAPPNSSLTGGQSATPTITFTPLLSSTGAQPATLTITADGQSCSFVLYAIAAFPSLEVRSGGTLLDSSSVLFVNQYSCVGEQALSYPLDLKNTNFIADTLWSTDIYELDTTYMQGAPRYPIRKDRSNNLIRSTDYVLSTQPAAAPLSANPRLTYPFVIPAGQTVRVYLTFVGQLENKRFARLFLRTNALNFAGPDVNGLAQNGMLRLDLFARGTGGHLSDNPNGGRPGAVGFPVTRIGDTVEQTITLYNTGTCNLRITPSRFEIEAGDLDEFKITQMPTSGTVASNGDLIFAPGASTTVKVRFKPSQVDSRRASIRVVTNDSTMVIPGVTERGVYYIDLYGTGKSDLYATGADLGTALIGGDATEHTHGVVRLQNTQDGPVIITKVALNGTDATEFMQDAAKPWPTKTRVVQGGEVVELGVEFAPAAGGVPGAREANVMILLLNGDTLNAKITGVAGTRTVEVTPTDIKFGQLTIGKKARRSFTVKNTGTMTLKVQQPDVQSAGGEFSATPLVRTDFAPGQVEIIEVTYAPQQSGLAAGTIDIKSNGTNGTQTVTLGGTARTRKSGDPDPSIAHGGAVGTGFDIASNGLEEFSVSGVSGVRDASGLTLLQSVPNPGRDEVEIGYILPQRGTVQLVLFDADGRMVQQIDAGVRENGERRIRVNVQGLASGVYHYVLTVDGSTLTRPLTVVH
ncbi:MAG: choice-of-anchor D domain-containing protein [Bacteroidetes bacterium]|nr:choice-of-anchor D domain-containing protein [Bacteroidota bacterium]